MTDPCTTTELERFVAVFAVHYNYPDDTSAMTAVRPEHREWLARQPGLLLAGMYQDGLAIGGEQGGKTPAHGALIVVTADSIEQVTTAFDHDPYWLGGHVLRRVVREWNPPLGPWADRAH